MANSEKITVRLPSAIVKEADQLAKIENLERSELIAKIIRCYLQEKCFGENLRSLQEGYEEMASINTALAELGMSIDLPLLEDYEGKISESD